MQTSNGKRSWLEGRRAEALELISAAFAGDTGEVRRRLAQIREPAELAEVRTALELVLAELEAELLLRLEQIAELSRSFRP